MRTNALPSPVFQTPIMASGLSSANLNEDEINKTNVANVNLKMFLTKVNLKFESFSNLFIQIELNSSYVYINTFCK
jgi:hypothetical protein